MAVGVRLSATDWVEGGWDLAESAVLTRELAGRGCSFLHVSSGGVSPRQQIPLGPGYQVPLAESLRRESSMPVIAVGLITEPEQAEAIVAEGRADAVALARALLFNPHWPWQAAARLGGQVQAPAQYWRSLPRGLSGLFGDAPIGQR
jgi:2,4-dienoyl-CoA reductase-like NADH-dependent reductase (Old Yellow Enzyme family)